MPEEEVIWEGTSENLAAKATSGHAAEHYKLTSEHLNIEKGILRTEAHQIRLEDIADVDLKQSLTQKATGKGDIVLRVETQGRRTEEQRLVWVAEPKQVRDLIGMAIRQARERHLETTRYVVQGTPLVPGPPASVAEAAHEDVFATLERLGKLHDTGVVTDEEFEAKKAELLTRL